MMTRTELIRALKGMQAETGSLICLGCGHEHNCTTQGCAIIRAAVEELEKIYPLTTQNAVPKRLFDDMQGLGEQADAAMIEQTRDAFARWIAQHVGIKKIYEPDSNKVIYRGTLEIIWPQPPEEGE